MRTHSSYICMFNQYYALEFQLETAGTYYAARLTRSSLPLHDPLASGCWDGRHVFIPLASFKPTVLWHQANHIAMQLLPPSSPEHSRALPATQLKLPTHATPTLPLLLMGRRHFTFGSDSTLTPVTPVSGVLPYATGSLHSGCL